jgi:hypothetical protein
MDENLFQLVTVALLGVTLLVLLVTLLTLNKLAKKIEEGSPSRAEAPYQGDDRVGEPPGHVAPAPRAEEGAAEPGPAAQTSTLPATAAVQESEPARRDEPEEAAAPAQVEESRPAVATAAPVQEQPAEATTSFEDAPEEQPFEREGRWWFKRGDELLVYDEQSGQWEPAPANSGPTSAVAPATGVDSGSEQSPAPGASQADAAQAGQDPGSFWKCTSCGAVNGSTATSCRMCFAPKP